MFQWKRLLYISIVWGLAYFIYNELIDTGASNTVVEKTSLSPCSCSRSLSGSKDGTAMLGIKSINSSGSSCSTWTTARGSGQKVVSFSLYGEFPGEYSAVLTKQLARVEAAYPGWIVRLHLDLSLKNIRDFACSIACVNDKLDLCDITNIPGLGDMSKSKGYFWRFLVLGDPLVQRFIIRDLDSPILQREVDAVMEWMSSGKCFHVMRDNFFHDVPMMAGMWGGCNSWKSSSIQDIGRELLDAGIHGASDQNALWTYLWPKIQESVMVHDSYSCEKFPGSLPFPTKRENFTFIGMRTYRKQFENDRVYPKCPEKCRPKDHQEWEFC